MKLKICGMKFPSNIKEISTLSPEYMGFIFYTSSPRNIEFSIPKTKNIKRVGVFVNAKKHTILQKITDYQLDFIQLHGSESPEFCSKFYDIAPVIKSFSINNFFDFKPLEAYIPYCSYFLFDTKGALPGGNGYTFDWNVLKDYPYNKPFLLSGGIGIEDVERLKNFIKSTNLPIYAIDVNSKFEIKPGYKNFKKLQEFKSIVDAF